MYTFGFIIEAFVLYYLIKFDVAMNIVFSNTQVFARCLFALYSSID